MGSVQSIVEDFQQGIKQDSAEELRLALSSLDELIRVVKSSKQKPNKWQEISYNLHRAKFRDAYKQFLQKKAHDTEAEAYLTQFSKLQREWNLIINPTAYDYSTTS